MFCKKNHCIFWKMWLFLCFWVAIILPYIVFISCITCYIYLLVSQNFSSTKHYLEWDCHNFIIVHVAEVLVQINLMEVYQQTSFLIISQPCTWIFVSLNYTILFYKLLIFVLVCFFRNSEVILATDEFCSDLSHNMLIGSIPSNFSDLPKLQRL